MAVEVAMAMLQRHGRWLVLLLDGMSTIFSACCLGLFGCHIDSGKTTEQALLGGPSQ